MGQNAIMTCHACIFKIWTHDMLFAVSYVYGFVLWRQTDNNSYKQANKCDASHSQHGVTSELMRLNL